MYCSQFSAWSEFTMADTGQAQFVCIIAKLCLNYFLLSHNVYHSFIDFVPASQKSEAQSLLKVVHVWVTNVEVVKQ